MGVKDSVNVLVKTRDEASRKFNKIGASAGGMGKMLRRAAAAGAAFLGLRQMVRFSVSVTKAFMEQEDAEARLNQTIKATGAAAGFTLKEMKSFASELQRVTIVGDEVTLSGMNILATFKNIKGDIFKSATVGALDMAAAMNHGEVNSGNLQATMIQMGKALNDPIAGLSALSRVGVTFSDQQKDQIKTLVESGNVMAAQQIMLNELESEFGGAAGQIHTTSGVVKQMGNAWGDLKEKIGEGIKSYLPGVTNKIKYMTKVIANLPEILAIAGLSFKLKIIGMGKDIKHTFTKVIPDLLSWFGRNWKDVFETLWRGTKSIFVNLDKNIVDFINSVWSWARGYDFNFEWTGLLDGFESTLKELPVIAKRELTGTEKFLAKEISGMKSELGKKMAEKIFPGVDTAQKLIAAGKIDIPTTSASKAAPGQRKQLAAAENRFLTYQPGRALDPVADNTKKLVDLTKKVVEGIASLGAKDQDPQAQPATIKVTNMRG